MKITCNTVIEFGTKNQRSNVQKSLEPDMPGTSWERCEVRLTGSGKKMRIKMEASDETALRATLNSMLKNIASLREVNNENRC